MPRLAATATACLLPLLLGAPVASAASNITVVAGGGTVNNTGAPTFTPTGPDSQIGVDQINAQLAAGTDVTLDTETDPATAAQEGTITVSAAVGSVSAADLILDADGLVDVDAGVSLVNGEALFSISAVGGVELDDVITGTLSVSAGDPVTQSGSATVAGNAHFVTNVFDDVTLTNASNDFGSVSAGVVSNLSVSDRNAIALGDLTTIGAFLLNAGGSVSQVPATGASILGGADISVGATNDVTLTSATNDFSAVAFDADNVNVVDSNLLTLSTGTVNGSLFVTTSGSIGQDAALTVAGTTTLAAGATGDITLDTAANDWSTVAVTSADDVSIRDANALDLGVIAVGDDLILNAGGAVTQTGAATVPGQTSAAGAPVILDHAGNDFGGNVTVTSSGGSAATVSDANDLAIDSSSSGGPLTAVADDDLTVPAGMTIAATGGLRLVADNGNPTAPAIGTGGITVGPNAALTGSGAIRMYGARRGDNSIAGTATFNGSTFSPGTLYAHSARERWGVYSPNGPAAAPFTFFYKDRDTSPPRAEIVSPVDRATYERDQVVNASYSCTDGIGGGTGVTKCEGPVPDGSAIDTATVGEKKFTVDVENGAGNRNRVTVTYSVVDTTRPPVIDPPPSGAPTPVGACTVRASGTTGADTLLGTTAGDALFGRAGDDLIKGGVGDDCLYGGAGDDRLRGGAGDDRLDGGRGDDVLNGGAGKNRYAGRRGDDKIRARNGTRDVVRCGRGEDVAVVDPADRTVGCETVRRSRVPAAG